MFLKSLAIILLIHPLYAQENRVLLNKINALTFRKGSLTTGRRGSPISQLKCIGGNACHKYKPELVMCQNIGSDGTDPIWKCETTDLPTELNFGSTDVTCEGYDYPNDPYILKGSCGLEYKLNIHRKKSLRQNNDSSGFSLVLIIMAAVIIMSCFSKGNHRGNYSGNNYGGNNSGPGFWTGAATGAALGSMATSYTNKRSRTPPRARLKKKKKSFGNTKRR